MTNLFLYAPHCLTDRATIYCARKSYACIETKQGKKVCLMEQLHTVCTDTAAVSVCDNDWPPK